MGTLDKETSEKFVGLLKKLVDNKDCPKKKIASHPMKEEWETLYEEFAKTLDEKKMLGEKADRLRAKFWNKVEGDLEIFDKQLKVNTEENIIEVYEDDCDSCDEK